MPTVHFTSHLQAFVECPSVEVGPGALGAVLDEALSDNERLRTYIFDEQRRLRRHVMLFVDGHVVTDRVGLTDEVAAGSEVHVMQALSGG
ncbi:hypothetical protein KOR34_06270 [Posidoniimonas corsicana]|uniref:ThiS family protein n=1 Tax=Posidoniimonas corsicana TaxID=1938618 RepID=A0A5C5VCN1_9BACT|nr:MoaD/ThiS family protein [Posidoniimonas corsicana]TWT35733.1 hypothetical protein KOR34_06270 [Posidoniimonas corsicana]